MSRNTKRGFSIVEFSASVAFLGMMLLGIATLMSNIMKIYNKGLTVRNVNETGEAVIDKIRSVISKSGGEISINPTFASLGTNVVYIDDSSVRDTLSTYYIPLDSTYSDGGTTATVQAGGMFCAGDYTFVWNTAPSIQRATGYATSATSYSSGASFAGTWDSDAGRVLYINTDKNPLNDYEHIKGLGDSIVKYISSNLYAPRLAFTEGISDVWQAKAGYSSYSNYCQVVRKYKSDKRYASDAAALTRAMIDVPQSKKVWTDLLAPANKSQDINLALYNFGVLPATTNVNTNESFYQISFTLGTVDGGADINRTGNYCSGKGKSYAKIDGTLTTNTTANTQYCAINKFDFTAVQKGEASL